LLREKRVIAALTPIPYDTDSLMTPIPFINFAKKRVGGTVGRYIGVKIRIA